MCNTNCIMIGINRQFSSCNYYWKHDNGTPSLQILLRWLDTGHNITYCKWGKICWAKLSRFSWFSRVTWKFFREYKCLSLIILNDKHFWPRQRESISAKTSVGLKPWIFSPANLSTSTVICSEILFIIICDPICQNRHNGAFLEIQIFASVSSVYLKLCSVDIL